MTPTKNGNVFGALAERGIGKGLKLQLTQSKTDWSQDRMKYMCSSISRIEIEIACIGL